MAEGDSRNGPFSTALLFFLSAVAVMGMGIVTGRLIGNGRGAVFGGVLATSGFIGVFFEVAFGGICEAVLRLIQPATKALNRQGLNPELQTMSPRLRRAVSLVILFAGIVAFVLMFQKW